jgi:hypothetical protein
VPAIPTLLLIALSLLLVAPQGRAHEFWLDAEAWTVPAGTTAELRIRVGDDMEGPSYSYLPSNVARSEAELGGRALTLDPRSGTDPAYRLEDLPDGLLAIVHETSPRRLRYRSPEVFRGFVAHKDLAGTLEAHEARGLPWDGVTESYTRHVKALVGVGDAEGEDRAFGLETEIVAEANPYRDDLSGGLPVRVMLRGAPRADAQVELFERAPDGALEVTLHRTDGEGRALLPVRPGHHYLADAVTMEPLDPEADGAMWRSLWAALTFGVPEG